MATSAEKSDAIAHAVSRYAAIIIPLMEAGAVGFATWVVIVLVGTHYLIHPSQELQNLGVETRRSPGIAIIVIYCVLLFPMALTYFRIIQIIWTNPGYVPLGTSEEKVRAIENEYDRLDGFVVDYQGNPVWCEKCQNYKPDRTHHCSEVGRCVKRMDHFCPWVGGIVSETNHKFFIQFLFYGSLYTIFVVIVMAVFVADHVKHVGTPPSAWLAALALSGFFGLFLNGMFFTSLNQAALNMTTIEHLNKRYAVHHLALFHPNPPKYEASENANLPPNVIKRAEGRSYIFTQTREGEHPWNLGVVRNLKDLMGEKWWDWFLPFKMSPFTKHTSEKGFFEFGDVVERLKRENGIVQSRRRSRRNSSNRHSRGSNR